MTEENSNYYKIIPEYVMFDEDLLKKPLAILIYGEISALSNKKGYSWASNKYYAERFHKSESTIKRMIAMLDNKGYITRKFIYREDGKEVEKRILSIASRPSLIEGVGAQMNPPRCTDDLRGGCTDDLDNNITINNIKDFSYERFINWFNELSGKHFKNVESNRKLIRARLNEGYTKEDLAKVVKLKVNQWKDNPEMNRYLRLSTLLAPSHFDNYLQEARDVPVGKKEEKLGSAPAAADNIHKTVDELEAEMNDQKSKDDSLIAFVEERPEAIEDNEVLRKEYEQAIERRNRA